VNVERSGHTASANDLSGTDGLGPAPGTAPETAPGTKGGTNAEPELETLQESLGYRFADVAYLRLALTHPSVAHEQGAGVVHNQRLEFLGDAVLQLVVTRELYEKFPTLGEGELTKARAQMVNRRTLADQARTLGIGGCLRLSRGEENHGGRCRPSALGDAFEALIGAIFVDGGWEAAAAFVLRRFHAAFGQMRTLPLLENPKGELQERLQAGSTEAPIYQVASIRGPDHDRCYECAVLHRGVELGRGVGKSKKEAESRAARSALENCGPAA
jgi:ribonuclease-3